ncbi:MAG: CDC48 family AAA ATPase [Thaumarchaeota archaeon]|nr:CDC48 family AAA ATPase [Nitrososphaerota archaeon]
MSASSMVTLKVMEAYTRDVGRGVARVDYEVMDMLNLQSGDVIEIKGKRRTVAKVLPLYPTDEGRGIIRIDGLIRSNAGVAIGDNVTVRKVKAVPAERIVISPMEEVPYIDERYITDALEGLPVVKGDNIIVPYFGGRITFNVIQTSPANAEAVIINQKTIIERTGRGQGLKGVPRVTYEDIGGLKEEIQKIREMVELPLRHPELFERLGIEPPKGVLLYGPPGTGKTLLAKAVANETNATFIHISGPEIMSKFYGESEARLREKFQEAKEKAPSIIFIDEIDAIAPKRDEVTGEVERRVVSQLLTLMDGLETRGKVIVIGATNRPNAIDPALRRPGRFDREIELKVPDKQGRLEILQIHTRNMPLAEDVDLEKIASQTHGFVGADLEYLAKEAAMKALKRVLPKINLEEERIPAEVLNEIKVTMQDFLDALKEITPSAMREVYLETPDVKWSDIGGLEEVKTELREAVEWPLKFPEVYKRLNYKIPKGILLYGPPGTGKTLLAKAVATESEANFISVRGPELLSKWVGESERAVREIFRKARQAAPCIIFFDEIDALAPIRGYSTDSGVTERVVSQLLTELDGIQPLHGVVVIASTNRIDMIDPALLRAGRFDKLIYVPMPDKQARIEILKIHTRGVPLCTHNEAINGLCNESDIVNLEKIAEATEGFSGADLESVVNTAISIVLQEYLKSHQNEEDYKKDLEKVFILQQHFEEAIKRVRASREGKVMEKAPVPYYR